MKKLLAGLGLTLVALCVAADASAERRERNLPGLTGQYRVVWDTTDRAFVLEVENSDRLTITRHGYDGRNLGLYFSEPFDQGAGTISILEHDGTAFSGTASANNVLYLTRGNRMVAFPLGAGQTASPGLIAGGLDMTGDSANNEGYELVSHVAAATGSPLIIGEAPDFYFSVTFTLGDVSDTDDFHCGLRKVEAVEAGVDDYTDVASLCIITSANPAAVQTCTAEDNAAMGEVDTTDTLADDTETTWRFNVDSSSGDVEFLADGATPTVPVTTFDFDLGDAVHPFCRAIHAGATDLEWTVADWTVDKQ